MTQTHDVRVKKCVSSQQSSVKFDVSSQQVSELDASEDPDLEARSPESLSVVSNISKCPAKMLKQPVSRILLH